MDISEDRKAEAVVLALSGRLDATSAKTFEDKILGVIGSGAQRLVVDLAQLEYVSSSGLRVFLPAAKRLQAPDGKIVLCGLQDHIRQVFDMAGFSSFLSIFGSRERQFKAYNCVTLEVATICLGFFCHAARPAAPMIPKAGKKIRHRVRSDGESLDWLHRGTSILERPSALIQGASR